MIRIAKDYRFSHAISEKIIDEQIQVGSNATVTNLSPMAATNVF